MYPVLREAVQHKGDRTMQDNRNVSEDRRSAASDAIVTAFIRELQPLGTGVLRYGLVCLLLFWGALKFAQFEAEAIQPLLAYSPLLFWMLAVFDVRTASAIIGVTEIILALGILTRRLWPRVSGLASLGASGMFLVTLSFLFSTPGILALESPAFGFLVKDLILLGAALYTAGEALHVPT
jgi:reactive chlorine resistance protein C